MLKLHRASRGDGLAAGLAEVLRTPLADPFVAEVIAVPTRGVERWLSQRLSTVLGARPGRGDGVCANVEFPFAAALVGEAVAAATGVARDGDPWLPERSVWPLLAVVDDCISEPWLAPLAAHLGVDGGNRDDRRARRFSTVRHLAELFHRYGVHRPQLLRAWADGSPTSDVAGEGWQAELWLRLHERIGVPSPAERLSEACSTIVADPAVIDLPGRVSLFGLTRLPPSHLDVLVALGARRDVHLWLLHPSPVLWERMATSGNSGASGSGRSVAAPANPLLRTWGSDSREMQMVLAAAGAEAVDAIADPESRPTLLGRIQADIRSDREPRPAISPDPADARPVLASDDRSLQVHACHGRARQVDVLRDAIVHLLADDDTLEPRDVIVMCPDIEAFAPLIHATFGPGGELEGADLHVRLADRALRQTNPVLGALARLLELAAGRVSASDVLDLAGTPPLRARFGFDDDELARLDGWARSSGVRWGIDAPWRTPYQLASFPDGTWAAGLDRLLTGVTMSEDPYALVGGVLPLDDVDSGDIDLAGRAAEMVARVGAVMESFSRPHTIGDWVEAIDAAADLLLGTAAADEWQRAEFRRLLDDVAAQAGGTVGGSDTEMLPAELRALLADRLRGTPTRANFRTGHLTMCTLVPMRSVPHRVVCLLGIDDGAFPRRSAPDADDLLHADPSIGDPDPRREDRQLLLDAVLAAGETLVITYAGRDERTNAPLPPAVPIAELLDVVDRTVSLPTGPARERVVVQHPLQPFDERNFIPGEVVPAQPWSFDRAACDGAEAARGARLAARAGFAERLAPLHPDPLVLDDLVRFVEHPVKAFLRQRLGVTVRGERPEPGDAITVELDPLERWQVGDRLLDALASGVAAQDCVSAELARGSLPPGRLGARVLEKLMPDVEALVAAAGVVAGRTPSLVDVTTTAGGVSVAGTVSGVFGDEILSVTYSKLGPKHRLGAWVRLLALSATLPEQPWQARTIGRGDRGVAVSAIGPLGTDPASRAAHSTAALSKLVDIYLRGMCEPLPLALRTSAAWAKALHAGRDAPADAARSKWVTGFAATYPSEDDDPAHRLVYAGRLPWDDLLRATPADDESGNGWSDEVSRAGRLAWRLWADLLAAEVLS